MNSLWTKNIEKFQAHATRLKSYLKHRNKTQAQAQAQENQTLLNEIMIHMVRCQALLTTLGEVNNPNQPTLQRLKSLTIDTLAAEGTILLETEQIRKDRQTLVEIKRKFTDLTKQEQFDPKEAEELAAEIESITERQLKRRATVADIKSLQESNEKTLKTAKLIQEANHIIQDMFEKELKKIGTLLDRLHPND